MMSKAAARLKSDRQKISGFVLAGGRSSRLGQDKVLLPWCGKTLLQHAIDLLSPICESVSICASRDDLAQHHSGSHRILHDALPDAGPLAGIVSALETSDTDWNFFLAVDLPLVPPQFLQAVAERATASAFAVIPVVDTIPQPLCGIYHRSLATNLRRALDEGNYKIMLALREAMETPAVQLRLLDARELAATAQIHSTRTVEDWFLNINAPEDLQRARALGLL